MKRFLLLLAMFTLFFTEKGHGQFIEDFEDGIPSDWETLKTINDVLIPTIGWTTTTLSALVCEGNVSAYVDRSNIGLGSVEENWLITPQITIPSGGRLYFTAKQTLSSDYGTNYIIKISTLSQTDMSSFTDILVLNESELNPAPYSWIDCVQHGIDSIIDLSAYSGQEVYIAFVRKTPPQPAEAPFSDRWILDMIKILEQCMPPTGEEIQTLTEGQTLTDLIVEGENLQWYADEDLTQPLEETHIVESDTTYYVTQTIGECTSEALAVSVEFTVGTTDFEVFAFSFYPNPVGDVLNLTSNVEITQIDLFNMLGQKVTVVANANNTQVDMSGLPTGNYIISITIEGITKTFKVVKN